MRNRIVMAGFMVWVGCSTVSAWALSQGVLRSDATVRREWAEASARVQLPFVENVGQLANEGIRFYAKTFAGTVYVTTVGQLIYALPQGAPAGATGGKNQWSVVTEECVGGSGAAPRGRERSAARANFFLGRDAARWKTGVPAYSAVACADVYPGIELAVRAYGRTVEKIFTLQPGADPEDIALRLSGVERLAVDEQGQLVAHTALGEAVFSAPVAYQPGAGGREYVAVNYWVAGERYGFELGDYDPGRPLVIDPLLGCTYHGGTGWDAAEAVAIDGQGRVYVTGFTGSDDFPITAGAYQTNRGNAFISLFDARLTNLVASTFLGGTNSETAYAITLDPVGRVIVTGSTTSPNFPVTSNAYQRTSGGEYDAFVSVLDPELGVLLASTYLGGTDYEWAECIALDAENRIHVAGSTRSTNFPTTSLAYSTNLYGYMDAFITRFDSNLTSVSASTYIGGILADGIEDLQISTDAVYGSGWTTSTNFPVTPLAHSTNYNGGISDAVIVKLDRALGTLQASTYLGGYGEDRATCLAMSLDTVYVAGYTYSSNFPVDPWAYQPAFGGGTNDGFAAGLDLNLTALRYGTFLGGTLFDFIQDLALDTQGQIWLAGYTESPDFPTTAHAYCRTNQNVDAFVSRLGASLTSLLASTLLGGTWDDYGYGMGLDPDGNVFICGYTESVDLPTTPGAYEPFYHQPLVPWYGDGFVAKFDSTLSDRPAPPLDVAASDDVYVDRVRVSWLPGSRSTGFILWRNTLNDSASAVAVNNVNDLSLNWCDDLSALAGITYYYWVTGTNSSGSSAFSDPDTGRINPTRVLTADYDGDGKADPALYRADTGTWYVRLSASGYGLTAFTFGGQGVAATKGDFDGDGKSDPAVYQAETGLWQVQLSGSGYAVETMTGFGGMDYQAVPGDYDGDGKADPAIYNQGNGDWQVAMSSLGYQVASASGFGGAGYVPAQANYDSDRRADAAVYSAAGSIWTVLLSAANYITATISNFGGPEFAPVLGDFDGDGLADPTVYRESDGSWMVMQSASQYYPATLEGFGGAGTRVAAADFDGDRKADPIYLDGASSVWHVKLSASGYAEATLASGCEP